VRASGNLDVAVQRERLDWVARLARLGERRRVAIHSHVYGEEYRKLLGRARIVFNRSIRCECNRRTFEAAAAGALLFQEAGNREVPRYFRDRQECVYYTADNLETLLDYYLEHEDEQQAIALAGRALPRRIMPSAAPMSCAGGGTRERSISGANYSLRSARGTVTFIVV
jgi:hypothetical protein